MKHSLPAAIIFLGLLSLCVISTGSRSLTAQVPQEGSLAGDLNGDRVVDLRDLEILSSQWMQFPEGDPADLNADDQVNAADFSVLGAEWRLDRNIPPILINEFVADNARGSGMEDLQGQADDWIELYNAGNTALDLAGMYISDDPLNPLKYQFPAGVPEETTIAAGGYLVLWPDNDIADGPLHLPFGLSAAGEEILLYKSDGSTLVDRVVFGEQKENLSLGRDPDSLADPKEWAFLITPTMGSANGPAYSGLVENLTCSLERGFYSESQQAVLYTPTPGAVIYYTLDGSSPILNGSPAPGATLYQTALQITGTTTLRAVGVLDENRPSSVMTRSFIFLADIRTQSDQTAADRSFPATWDTQNYSNSNGIPDYAMDPEVLNQEPYNSEFEAGMLSIPSVSLVMDLEHLFDPETGIYTNVWGYHDSTDPTNNWERPVSMEIFDPLSSEKIQVDCAIRLVGNDSRKPQNSKHSLRLSFRDRYGAPELTFPLFPGSQVDTFETIALRSQYHTNWVEGAANAQYIRDPYVLDTQRAMGHLSPHYRFVHLYINGLYWGLYEAAERPDNDFLAAHEGGNPEDYEVIEGVSETPAFEWKGLGDETWSTLWNLFTPFSTGNPVDASTYAAIQELLDLDQFIDHVIMNTWLQNNDWGPKNWYAGSQRAAIAGEALPRKWQFYPWDNEATMEDQWYMPIPFTEYVGGPRTMHNALHNNPEYRLRFADRIQVHCLEEGGVLTPSVALNRYNALIYEVYAAIIGESARWGDFVQDHLSPAVPQLFTRGNQFDTEWDWFKNTYFTEADDGRSTIAIGKYKDAGLFPDTVAPELQLNGQPSMGGALSSGNQITLSANGNPIYYTLDNSPILVYSPPIAAGPDIQLFSRWGARKYLVPTSNIGLNWTGGAEPFDDSGWASANGGVGYDRASDYLPYISANVGSLMDGIQTSCYIRVPFTLTQEDLNNINFLKLRIQYDSGFVAYLNGVESVSVYKPDPLEWNAQAAGDNPDYRAIEFEEFDLGSLANQLKVGTNVLAIHGMNGSFGSSDFLISFELIGKQASGGGWELSPSALEYTTPLELAQSTTLRARSLENGEWSPLTSRKFTFGNPVADLRITELMYNPAVSDAEFIEIQNNGSEAIDLNGITVSDGVSYTFGVGMLAAGERVLIVENQLAFESHYGTGLPVAGEYTGALRNSGEQITLRDTTGAVIQSFDFRDGWYDQTDGDGYSLALQSPMPTDATAWSNEDAWKPSARWGGSPGAQEETDVPMPNSIVISEVLAHSDQAPNDWIELYNTGGSPVDLSGWFLSDDSTARMKYRIAAGTTLPAGGYLVFTQDNHFGVASTDPGKLEAFALSENGEMVVVTAKLDALGHHHGYFEEEDFGAADPEVSMGRHLKASTGTFNFVALTSKTAGSTNAAPIVGPVVISEIHYHPDWPSDNTYSNEDYEFIRITNISNQPVPLYDATVAEPWKIDGAVDYIFPSNPRVMAVGESLYIVKSSAAFQARYPGVVADSILGPFTGNLSNDGEALNLSKPGDIDNTGVRQFIRVDRVAYSDGSHPNDGSDLWPTDADGYGQSLQRAIHSSYGNDPANWSTGAPSPHSP